MKKMYWSTKNKIDNYERYNTEVYKKKKKKSILIKMNRFIKKSDHQDWFKKSIFHFKKIDFLFAHHYFWPPNVTLSRGSTSRTNRLEKSTYFDRPGLAGHRPASRRPTSDHKRPQVANRVPVVMTLSPGQSTHKFVTRTRVRFRCNCLHNLRPSFPPPQKKTKSKVCRCVSTRVGH